MRDDEADTFRKEANAYWRETDPLREKLIELLTEEHQDWYTRVHLIMAIEKLIDAKVSEATDDIHTEMERLSPGYLERRAALKGNDNRRKG